IRLAVDALSADANPRRLRGPARSFDAGEMDEAGRMDAQASLSDSTRPHAWLSASVLRRNADAGHRSWAETNEDMPVLDSCDGRSVMAWARASGGRLCVRRRARQEGH